MNRPTIVDAQRSSQGGHRLVTRARARGCDVSVDLYIDTLEVERRRRVGLGSLLSLDLLNLLLRLPLGSRFRQQDFSAYQWGLLTRAGEAVDLERNAGRHGWVTRWAVPPVDVEMVTISARSWRSGLDRASRFAPYAARRVVLERMPIDDTLLRLEAAYRGVGIAVSDSAVGGEEDHFNEIVVGAQFAPQRFTGASWRLAEVLFAQTGLCVAADSRATNHR